jgi:hypothetical protein
MPLNMVTIFIYMKYYMKLLAFVALRFTCADGF